MNEKDVVCNRFGTPVLRLLDDNFVTFSGQHLGFSKDKAVYNFSGRQVGWYENGMLRDLSGSVVGFGQAPTDYPSPLLPFRQLRPLPSLPHIAPLRPLTELPHLRPLKSFSWSVYEPINLFSSR